LTASYKKTKQVSSGLLVKEYLIFVDGCFIAVAFTKKDAKLLVKCLNKFKRKI